MHAERKQEKAAERKKNCQLQSQDGGQCRWTVGVGVPRKKELLGAGTTKKSRGQREPTDGLESQHGVSNSGPKKRSQCVASRRQMWDHRR